MSIENILCECGCGKLLSMQSKGNFYSDYCKARSAKANKLREWYAERVWLSGLDVRTANCLLANGFTSKEDVNSFVSSDNNLKSIEYIGISTEREILEWLKRSDKDGK